MVDSLSSISRSIALGGYLGHLTIISASETKAGDISTRHRRHPLRLNPVRYANHSGHAVTDAHTISRCHRPNSRKHFS